MGGYEELDGEGSAGQALDGLLDAGPHLEAQPLRDKGVWRSDGESALAGGDPYGALEVRVEIGASYLKLQLSKSRAPNVFCVIFFHYRQMITGPILGAKRYGKGMSLLEPGWGRHSAQAHAWNAGT